MKKCDRKDNCWWRKKHNFCDYPNDGCRYNDNPDHSKLEIVGKELGIENCKIENIIAEIKRIKAIPSELERWVKYFQEQWREQDNIYKNYVSYDSLLDKIQEFKEGK